MKKYFIGAVFLALWLWQSFNIVQNMYWYQMNPIAAFYMSIAGVTRWSKGYSENAFASVKIGDSSETVFKALGQPLNTEHIRNDLTSGFNGITKTYYFKGDTIWYYSIGPDGIGTGSSDGSIHINFIVFDEKMRVRKIIKSFNID